MKCIYVCKGCNKIFYRTKMGYLTLQTKLKNGTCEFPINDYDELCSCCRKSKGNCVVCNKLKYNQGVTCSKKCAQELKKKSYLETCDTPHNFSKKSKSRLKWENELVTNEGIVNVFQRECVKEKIKETITKKYGDGKQLDNISQSKHWRVIQMYNYIEKNGIDNFLALKSDPEMRKKHSYYANVWSITISEINKYGKERFGMNYDDIKNINRLTENYKEKLSIDHKFPISKGYQQNVDFRIIGSIHNIDIITVSENCSKGTRYSTIKLKELKRLYENSKNN